MTSKCTTITLTKPGTIRYTWSHPRVLRVRPRHGLTRDPPRQHHRHRLLKAQYRTVPTTRFTTLAAI